MIGSVAVEEALLVLKVAFLVLLYLFIWRIVRSAARDVRMPQESFVLAPGSVPGLGQGQPQVESGRLVVVKSPALEEGDELTLDSAALLLGRGSTNASSPRPGTDPGASTKLSCGIVTSRAAERTIRQMNR